MKRTMQQIALALALALLAAGCGAGTDGPDDAGGDAPDEAAAASEHDHADLAAAEGPGFAVADVRSRGLDVLELEPSEHLSQNEIEAAKLVVMEEYNPQSQPVLEWPAAFPVVRSYLDQLVRGDGLPAAGTSEIAEALDAAEAASGAERREMLNGLASELDADASGASDAERVRAMAGAVRELAEAS